MCIKLFAIPEYISSAAVQININIMNSSSESCRRHSSKHWLFCLSMFQNSLTLNQPNQPPAKGPQPQTSTGSGQTYQQQFNQYMTPSLQQAQYQAAQTALANAANPLLSQADFLKALGLDLPQQVLIMF